MFCLSIILDVSKSPKKYYAYFEVCCLLIDKSLGIDSLHATGHVFWGQYFTSLQL